MDTTHERTAIEEPSGALVVPAMPAAATVEAQPDAAEGRRYMAVVSEVPGVEVFAESEHDRSATRRGTERHRTRRGTERYATDLPLLIVSALLAGSTFLEWYKGPPGFGISASGWASGTWGPIILFLAIGSVLLVGQRRLGVDVSLPVDESLLHEGAGWVSLVGAVLKSRLRPGPADLLTASYGVYVTLGIAVVLIVVAGRMSPHAPFVIRPGWSRGRGGAMGAAVLVAVVAGAAVFGTINSASLEPKGNPSDLLAGTVRGRVPDCAKGFPLTEGLKPQYGFGTGAACQAVLSGTKTPPQIAAEFRALLKSKSYVFTEITGAPGSVIMTITKPRCATLAIVPGETGATVAVALTTCASPQPTVRPTARSS